MYNHNYFNPNSLYHFGVIGMKWGVHRNPSKTYAKAMRKKYKLDKKSANLDLKAAKAEKKSIKKEMHATNEFEYRKSRELHYKSNKLQLKSAKLKKKAVKWEKRMNKTFSSYTIERVPDGNIKAGKSFVYRKLYGNASWNVTKAV